MTQGSPRHPREHFLIMCIFQVLPVLRSCQRILSAEGSCWGGPGEAGTTLQPCHVRRRKLQCSEVTSPPPPPIPSSSGRAMWPGRPGPLSQCALESSPQTRRERPVTNTKASAPQNAPRPQAAGSEGSVLAHGRSLETTREDAQGQRWVGDQAGHSFSDGEHSLGWGGSPEQGLRQDFRS